MCLAWVESWIAHGHDENQGALNKLKALLYGGPLCLFINFDIYATLL